MGIKFSGFSSIDGLIRAFTPPEPADFSDALLWYDFSDESTVTLVNTDEISSVSNKGTHGGSISPLNGGTSRFKYVTSGTLNGLKAVDINGTAVDSLTQSDSNLLSVLNADMSYYFVIARTAVRTTFNFAMTTTKINPVAGGTARWEHYSQFDNGPADFTVFVNRGGGSTFSSTAFGDFVSGADVVSVRWDGGSTIKLSRTADATEYTIPHTRNISANCFYHITGAWGGNRPTLGQYQMGEFFMYPTYLDDTTNQEKIDELKSKWGVA